MQTRLLSSLAGGCFGVLVASPVNGVLLLSPKVALIGCALMGVALGYAVSIFFDVFADTSTDLDTKS